MGAPSKQYFPQEQTSWHQAQEANTQQAYSTFLTKWPEGVFAEEARKRITRIKEETLWNWAHKQHQIVAYEKYLNEYPDHYYSQAAYENIATLEEHAAWERAIRKNTIPSYLEFRREFADSQRAEEAAQRIVSLVKSRSKQTEPAQPSIKSTEEQDLERATMQDSVMAYNQFLRTYPDSQYQPEIQDRIQQLEARLTSSFRLLENEVEAWDKATRLHTRYGYQEYLEQFPSGKFHALAKNRIIALDQQWKWKHRALIEEDVNLSDFEGVSYSRDIANEQAKAATSLGWLWLGVLVIIGGLSIWLAPYLLPLTVVLGLAFGAHVLLSRGKILTRNETLPYLIGGSLAAGALVQGLMQQITGQVFLSLLSGALAVLLTGLLLVRFFQNQLDSE